MLEQALYKVPKKLGWFEHSEESLLLADNFAEAKPSEEKPKNASEDDCDYKAIN